MIIGTAVFSKNVYKYFSTLNTSEVSLFIFDPSKLWQSIKTLFCIALWWWSRSITWVLWLHFVKAKCMLKRHLTFQRATERWLGIWSNNYLLGKLLLSYVRLFTCSRLLKMFRWLLWCGANFLKLSVSKL